MIKTKQDLERIKLEQQSLLKMREGKKKYRIVVALGEENKAAQDTLNEFINRLDAKKIFDCAVFFGPKSKLEQTPIVEIHGNGVTTTYINVKKEVVTKLIESHIVNNKPLLAHVYKEGS